MSELTMEFDDGTRVVVSLRSDETPTTKGLKSAAPFRSSANRWGDEVYFEAPVSAPLEGDARDVMDVGEVAYWPDGKAIAVFFGRTPVSNDDRPRAYSPCNIVGTVKGDPHRLRSVKGGSKVSVTISP